MCEVLNGLTSLFVVCLLFVCCLFVVCLLFAFCLFVGFLLFVCCLFVVCLFTDVEPMALRPCFSSQRQFRSGFELSVRPSVRPSVS